MTGTRNDFPVGALAGVGAEEVELGDDRVVVCDVHAHVLMALVRERGALGAVIAHDGIRTFVDLAQGRDLVTRNIFEDRQARVPVMIYLRPEVLRSHREPTIAQRVIAHVLPRFG